MDRKTGKDKKLSGRDKPAAKAPSKDSGSKKTSPPRDAKASKGGTSNSAGSKVPALKKTAPPAKPSKPAAVRDVGKPKAVPPAKDAAKPRDAKGKDAAKAPASAKGKTPPPKEPAAEVKAPPKRKRKSTEVRLKAFWGVFNQMLKRVAVFEYSDRKAADKKAAELGGGGKQPHFVQLVKEVIRDE